MVDQAIIASAEALARARRSGTLIEGLPMEPSSIAHAHAIQDQVAHMLGEMVGAFKANAPPDQGPTRGLIYARHVLTSPARVPVEVAPHCGVEGEVAFRFTRDFPQRAEAYTRTEVAASLRAMPAIEVVSARFPDARTRPALEQLADNIANAALVLGPETASWSQLDFKRLRVEMRVNDQPVAAGEGGHPIGDPVHVAVALVNLMREGNGVSAGQVVTTGSWTGLRFLQPGDRCSVSFDTLGSAEVTFVA